MTSYISPSSTKEIFAKERHIDGPLVKYITLSENTPVRLIAFCLSESNILYCFLYFLVTLMAGAFQAQMYFNCYNFL